MPRSFITQTRTRLPERSRFPSQRGPHPGGNTFVNAGIVLATVAVNDLILTFDQPITVNSLPAILTDVALAVPVSFVLAPARLILTITFDISIAAALLVVIPNNDDAIRTRTGGWPVSFQFPVTP